MPEWYGAKLLAPPPRAEPEPAQNAPPKEQDDPDGRPKQPAAECVDEPMDAADLCPAQWKRVVDRVALFNGYVMTKRPPNPTIGPARALFVPIKAGAFPVPDFNPGKMSTASVLVTFSEEEEANAQAGFTDVKVSASYGFASASVGVRKEQKSSSQSSSSSTRAVANFLLQRATVEIDRDRIGFPFRTNPDFIAGVGKIAAAIESDERKYEMYFGMLESWGHVYPKRIVLGGRLTSSFALSTQAASNSRETSSQIKVEVEAKFGNAGGGVSAGRGKSESSSSGSSSFTQSSSWTAYGGKTSLVSGGISASGDTSPFEEWKRSVDQGVGNWAVVAMSNFVPVHQLLPDDLRKAVESWQAKYEATRPPIAAALGFDGWTPMPGWNMRYGGAVKPNDMVKWDGVDGLYNYGKQASEDDCRALCEADQACWAYIWESPQSSAAEWRTYCHGRSAFMWTAENPGMWGLLVQSQDGLFSGYKNYRDDWIRINAGDTKPDGDPYRISYFLGDFWSPSDFGKAQVCRGCKCVKQYLGNMPTYDMCKAACLSRNNNGGQVQCQVDRTRLLRRFVQLAGLRMCAGHELVQLGGRRPGNPN
ncbi:hypothetical protein DFJ74DRAFT_692904 [Hyaloraphidium curvatum]|nr:hypothetical protein DFJ74DRAFT_692904 [Hyaloraphidium curvatum]